MNVVICSRTFLPNVGGLERMMALVASALVKAGHTVTVVTATPGDCESHSEYLVLRRVSFIGFLNAAVRADVCLVANITLRTTPILILLGRKTVTSHQLGYHGIGQYFRPFVKRMLTRFTHNIFCSEAVSHEVPGRGIVIPNGYDSDVFFERPDEVKDRDVVFVGRLVSVKGCKILLEAIATLRDQGLRVTVTIVGIGPELSRLKDMASDTGLNDSVVFAGELEGESLARVIAKHRILAVPSTWEEPFGIVALEGAACGCAIIGTNGGGLPEAIGRCGLVVERGDSKALAMAIKSLMTDHGLVQRCRNAAPEHLQRYNRETIGRSYCSAIERVAAGGQLG
jgi:glycogen(starch) synthase